MIIFSFWYRAHLGHKTYSSKGGAKKKTSSRGQRLSLQKNRSRKDSTKKEGERKKGVEVSKRIIKRNEGAEKRIAHLQRKRE